jgi:hypothetical protein
MPAAPASYAFPVARNAVEYLAIIATWGALFALQSSGWLSSGWMTLAVLAACWLKTAFFGVENMQQLFEAARTNLPHHRFLLLMGINMSQMILSFMFDFHLLQCLDAGSFSGVAVGAGHPELLFDFFYLSTLNFSFFGYSDILPQTVAARLVNLTEIILAFVTVIFMLSDFISLKDSLRSDAPR